MPFLGAPPHKGARHCERETLEGRPGPGVEGETGRKSPRSGRRSVGACGGSTAVERAREAIADRESANLRLDMEPNAKSVAVRVERKLSGLLEGATAMRKRPPHPGTNGTWATVEGIRARLTKVYGRALRILLKAKARTREQAVDALQTAVAELLERWKRQ